MKHFINIVSPNITFAEGLERIVYLMGENVVKRYYLKEVINNHNEQIKSDLVILDIDDLEDPVQTIQAIKSTFGGRIALIGSELSRDLVHRSTLIGINGIILKTTSAKKFYESLNYILQGYIYLDTSSMSCLFQLYKTKNKIQLKQQPEENSIFESLTLREKKRVVIYF